jgi:type I restriction enzyme S subunit
MKTFSTAPLRRVFRVVNGGTPTADPINWDGDVPWVTPADLAIVNGRLVRQTSRTLTAVGLKTGSMLVPSGSLIVSTRAPVGYIVEVTRPTAFNQGCRGLVPRRAIDNRYFRYQFTALTDTLQSRSQGSTFLEISSDSLADIRLLLPRIEIQHAIADYLDAETTGIDALIRTKGRMIALLATRLRLYRWAEISKNISGFEKRRLGAPTGLAEKPWRQTRLKFLVGRPQGGAWGSVPGDDEVDVACYRVADFDRWHASVASQEPTIRSVSCDIANRLALAVDDLLLEKSGGGEKQPVGFVARFAGSETPAICSNFIARFRPDRECDPQFLTHLFASLYDLGLTHPFIKQTTGIQNLDTSAFLSQGWAIPSLSEQVKIRRRIDASHARASALRTRLSDQISLLRERRQALITAAVTGELDIPGASA